MLQQAIESRNYILAKELLAQGEKLPSDIQSYRLDQIYRFLISDNQFEILNSFIEYGIIALDVYEYDSFSNSIFSNVVGALKIENEGLDFLTNFLSKVENLNDEIQGNSLLGFALEKETHPEIIKCLIAAGCNVHIIDSSEHNLIHKIIKKRAQSYEKGVSYLDILFDAGVDIHTGNIVGDTALHFAVEQSKPDYLQWLLDHGADLNATNKKGVSPYFKVIASLNKFEYYNLMRNYGAPLFEQVNLDGETMFYEFVRHMSAQYDLNFLKQLLKDGASVYMLSNHYGPKTTIDIAVTKPADIISLFLEMEHLDVHWKDNNGNTTLHKVCDIETLREEKRAKEVYRIAKLLLAAGADVNAVNDKEETPLMLASKDNAKVKTVELLLTNK